MNPLAVVSQWVTCTPSCGPLPIEGKFQFANPKIDDRRRKIFSDKERSLHLTLPPPCNAFPSCKAPSPCMVNKPITMIGWRHRHAGTASPSLKWDCFDCCLSWQRSRTMINYSVTVAMVMAVTYLHRPVPFHELSNYIDRKQPVLNGFHKAQLVTVVWIWIEVLKIYCSELGPRPAFRGSLRHGFLYHKQDPAFDGSGGKE